jgi:2-octaprenylphenol hydroxylase
MATAMESIKQVFTPQNPVTQLVRGLGMNLFDNVKPVKQLMAKQALGMKEHLPSLATVQE